MGAGSDGEIRGRDVDRNLLKKRSSDRIAGSEFLPESRLDRRGMGFRVVGFDDAGHGHMKLRHDFMLQGLEGVLQETFRDFHGISLSFC